MEIFHLTLKQMLMMLSLIAVGYLLRKKSILPENAGNVMAKLETYIFVPSLMLYNQISQCKIETFKENYTLILYGGIIIICAVSLSYPLSRFFVKDSNISSENAYKRNIYKYALVFGNYGFMGNFIILGVFGEEFLYKYILFTFFVGIMCTGWGIYILVPKNCNESKWNNLKNGLFNPPIIALIIGMLFGLLNLKQYIPEFLLDALDNSAMCQGAVAMILAGFIIGGYNFKDLITDKKVYVATIFRLIIIPSVIMVIMKFLGTSSEIMILALIAFGTPLGLNTIVYPAAYGGETKIGASMALVSHIFSVITLPLMYLIFLVLF